MVAPLDEPVGQQADDPLYPTVSVGWNLDPGWGYLRYLQWDLALLAICVGDLFDIPSARPPKVYFIAPSVTGGRDRGRRPNDSFFPESFSPLLPGPGSPARARHEQKASAYGERVALQPALK